MLVAFNVGRYRALIAQVENTFQNNLLSLTQIISIAVGLTQIIKFLPCKIKHSLLKLLLYCECDSN